MNAWSTFVCLLGRHEVQDCRRSDHDPNMFFIACFRSSLNKRKVRTGDQQSKHGVSCCRLDNKCLFRPSSPNVWPDMAAWDFIKLFARSRLLQEPWLATVYLELRLHMSIYHRFNLTLERAYTYRHTDIPIPWGSFSAEFRTQIYHMQCAIPLYQHSESHVASIIAL